MRLGLLTTHFRADRIISESTTEWPKMVARAERRRPILSPICSQTPAKVLLKALWALFNTLIHSPVGCQRIVINGGPARKKGPFRKLIETWGGIGIRCRKWSQAINKCTVDLPTQRIFMHARLGDRSTGQLKMPEMPGQDPFQNYAKYKCLHILSTLVRWWYAWSHQRWGTTIRLCTKCARWFHATYTMPH